MATEGSNVQGRDKNVVVELQQTRIFLEQLLRIEEKLDKVLLRSCHWPLPQEGNVLPLPSLNRDVSVVYDYSKDEVAADQRREYEAKRIPGPDADEAPQKQISSPLNSTKDQSKMGGLRKRDRALSRMLHDRKPEHVQHTNLVGRRSTLLARSIVKTRLFENIMGSIICLNCVLIGIHAQMSLDDERSDLTDSMEQLEFIFLTVYVVELSLRCVADGVRVWRDDGWVTFDLFLVILSFLNYLADFLKHVILLRLLRVARLLKALQVMQLIRPLWKLIYGFMTSIQTMFSMIFLLCSVFFIFACIGVELITKDAKLKSDPGLNIYIDARLSSIPIFMLTLLQFASGDSQSSIYFDLILAKPVLALYFLPLILIVSIILMNILNALIVESVIENASADKAIQREEHRQQIKRFLPMIHKVFNQIDDNGSGHITMDEICAYDVNLLPEVFLEHVDPDSMIELFEMLDVDGSSEVSETEFVEGVLHMCLTDVPVQIIQILKLVRTQFEYMKGSIEYFKHVQAPPRYYDTDCWI